MSASDTKLKTHEKVVEIPLVRIEESPTNPRVKFDPNNLGEMAATIKSTGVVQPVIVRPHPSTTGRFQLVFGARRYRASALAEKETIPGIVRNITDEQILLIQFIENDQREDLDPLSQARGYAALIATNPAVYTVEELSFRLGKNNGRYVAERLQILKGIPDVQKLLENERLPFRHAFELSRLTPEQQEKALYVCFSNFTTADAVIAQPNQTVSISLDALREWIKNHFHLDLNHAPFPTDQPVGDVVACKDCPKRAGTAPMLFADIATEDTCLDPECFENKKQTLVQIRVQELERSGAQVVSISNNLRVGASSERPDVLYRGEYRVVERDSCEYTQVAVCEEASQQEVYVCTEDTCSVHKGKTKYVVPEERSTRKERKRDQREESDFRAAVLLAVKDRIPKVAQKTDLQTVAIRLLTLMPHENRLAVFKTFKWLEEKSNGQRGGKHVDYVALGKERIAKLGVFELTQFLIVASLTPDLVIPNSQPEQKLPADSTLASTARRLKVDLRSVRTKTSKNGKPKAKAS